MKRITSKLSSYIIKKVSRNYIAGPNLSDAISLTNTLVAKGYSVTIGYWDGNNDSPVDVQKQYLDIINHKRECSGLEYISIKLPSLNFCPDLYEKIKKAAEVNKIAIHFDALTETENDKTLEFLHKESLNSRNIPGCTLPARWCSSKKSSETAILCGSTIRIVKGQLETTKENSQDPHIGFLDLVRHLAGRVSCVRIATHNCVLAEKALTILGDAGTSAELELLYGLPVRNIIPIAQRHNVKVRIYIAYGSAYLPYALTSLKKRPSDLFRLLKEMVRGDYMNSFPEITNVQSST